MATKNRFRNPLTPTKKLARSRGIYADVCGVHSAEGLIATSWELLALGYVKAGWVVQNGPCDWSIDHGAVAASDAQKAAR